MYLVVFCCLHFNTFAKTNDNYPVILKPTPIKALPVRFKPLPFKPIYLSKVDLYQFDQKAYVFGKITSAFPILTAQEWQTVSNDPIRFTLTPNKTSAYVGEEIELILTAELLNISPSTLFTFEELREYTLKVVLPKDFIQTGGTYYDFVSDKLDTYNPKKTYTIKGRYLASPAMGDCFQVLRKLNNEVFILKDSECTAITEVDIPVASINPPVILDSVRNAREIAAIDLSKVRIQTIMYDQNGSGHEISANESTIYLNCYKWPEYNFISHLHYESFQEIKSNNGSMHWTISQLPGGTPFTICQTPSLNGDWNGAASNLLSNSTQYTSIVKIYSTTSCNGTPLTTLSKTYTIDRTSICPNTTVDFTITASSTTICAGNSATLEASGNCSSANIIWKKNDVTFNGGSSITVSEAGNYKAVCSSPAMTSNTITISVNSTPSAPTVTFDKNTLTPGEFAQLTASNCSGTILWTGPNNFADVGNQISVNKAGAYNAKCQTSCGGSYYNSSLSATINISVAPLRIQADKSQIRPGESVTLTAYGCINGYIKWKINDNLQPGTDNPFTFNSSGLYSASCNSWDGSYTSEWVSIFIHQLAANTPTIAANKIRAYNNESVVLTATGCTAYYWIIPVRLPNGTYSTPTPVASGASWTATGAATYQVGCTNQGPWASVTVYQIQPGDITITANKTVANSGEAVELSITGDCPGTAGIQWKIAGENSWTNRYESKTVYGSGTYEARCIVDNLSYGNWTSIRINAPAPGGITITSNKTSAGSSELVSLVTNGCEGEVIWTLPNNTEVRGTSILFATGPGTYKARCVRFGINGTPATIVIQSKPNDAPRFYATQATASGNQIFQLVAENCPNNYVQWGIPKLDANGNTYYDYANFFQTLIVRGPGTYQVRCNEGNYTTFQDIIVFPNPSDALTIVANKAKALPTEDVVLTAYGCPNGIVQWEIGSSTISGVQITRQGPGNYKARCVGDPTNNGDYAIASVMPNGSIVPLLGSTHSTACPGESVTLTAYSFLGTFGCPSGWPVQWQFVKPDKIDYWLNNRNAIENFGENYGEVFEIVFGSSITRTGPNIYYARCMKPDGTWMGEFKDKSFIVEPVFPEYLRASNNGPALMGATGIRVAVTEVPGASISYAWAGPGGFTSTARNPEITGLTEAKSGVYTVTVKKGNPVACSVTATTNLVVSGCGDIKIKATDPATGNETYSLPIVASQSNPYGPLALTPVYRDGSAIPFSTFLWTKPDGTTATGEFLVVNTPGIYKVKVSPNGSTSGCTTISYIIKENFHIEQWEKAQSLNFKDGTAVTVVPILHKSVDKSGIWYDPSIKENPLTKNVVISKLLRYTLPDGSKQSEILYIIPTPYYLAHNNHTINGNNIDGYVFAFSENEQQYLGGWYYRNGVPLFRTVVLDKLMGLSPFKCYDFIARNRNTGKLAKGSDFKGNFPFDPETWETQLRWEIPCNDQPNGYSNDSDNDNQPQPDPIPNFPNCPGCGLPGWEWNKPRSGGGGSNLYNYSPYTPGILKDEYEFNQTSLNQYRDGIARILSEVGNRYPDFDQFSPDELKLLVTLIRNTLIRLFPNDANSFHFADPTGVSYVEAFKNNYYKSLAQILVNGFGTLQTSNPNVIRNKILDNMDNIVNTFYALTTISKTIGGASGQNIVEALYTSFMPYELQKLSMTGQILANTADISAQWRLFSSKLQKQIQVVNSKQEKIVASANTNLFLTKPDALEETSIIDIETLHSDNSMSTVNITSDDPPFSTKGAIDINVLLT